MRAVASVGVVILAFAAALPSSARQASKRLLVVIDQSSLHSADCDRVAAEVGGLASSFAQTELEVVIAAGGDVVRPTATEEAVRASLCGSTAFLDGPATSMTASEAFEILRRDEAVRDAVIRRTCTATPAAGCGAGVGATAQTLMSDLQKRSDAFVGTVERLVSELEPATVLVLVSAGPPTSDLSRTTLRRLEKAALKLRQQTGVLMAPSRGQGALARAQQRSLSALGESLHATVASLHDNTAVTRAVNDLIANVNVGAAVSVLPSEPPASSRQEEEIVQRAVAHAADFARQAVVILATEKYEQEIRSRAGSFGLSGSTSMGITRGRRRLESEVALVQVLDGSLWMIARDVLAVDGRAVAKRPSIAASMPTGSIESALRYLKETADSGARFNIGDIRRNLNTPTLALLVLLDPFRQRFSFDVGPAQNARTILQFRERASPPTMFQINDGPAPSAGRLWVDAETGAIHRTELVLASRTTPATRATVTVDYERVPEVGAWMPRRMTEKYEQPGSRESDWIECTATYSQFRRFTVTSKIR